MLGPGAIHSRGRGRLVANGEESLNNINFAAFFEAAENEQPIEPRELYEQLPTKAQGYGYLRDVQAQVLTQWHEKRRSKDIVLKVNTGGGKTIDGLVILQSYLNEGISPALYVAPTKYLVQQVLQEAAHLGIAVVNDPEDTAYIAGEAIAVINAAKLFNGKSVFSENRQPDTRIPIGAVVIDDAHAILATMKSQLSLTIPKSNGAFAELLALFEKDLKEQSPETLLDIQDGRGGGFVRVPFWSQQEKLDNVRAILRNHKDEEPFAFSLRGVRDVLSLARIVFTPKAVTIVPPNPHIHHIRSFVEASRRVFLTATLANDSVLVTDFGAIKDRVLDPVQPLTAGDIGERMILAPEEITKGIEAAEVRKGIRELSRQHNTLVIVPSHAAIRLWEGLYDLKADAEDLEDTVASMRARHVGLVVLANKYDGIDLPQDACRVLVIDGLPEAFSGDERLETLMETSATSVADRQVQRIEQGMGRAVRSNEDHCVVFLLGRRLSQLTADPKTVERFSPATQRQLKTSRDLSKTVAGAPLSRIMGLAETALARDEGWVVGAKRTLRGISPKAPHVDADAEAWRISFDQALAGDFHGAATTLAQAIDGNSGDKHAGRLLEQQAAYVNFYDKAQAQLLLAEARQKNAYALRPIGGLTFRALDFVGAQAQRMAERLTSNYGHPAHLLVGVQGIVDRLQFDPSTTEEFEDAVLQLGLFLGLGSQRPERELGNGGPDNLWAVAADQYWVIEAKSGVTTEFIAKRDVAQLGQSQFWFGSRYAPQMASIPVMFHPSRKLHKEATAVPGMRVLDERATGELCADVLNLAEGLAQEGWSDLAVVNRLLVGSGLDLSGLTSRLRSVSGGQIGV